MQAAATRAVHMPLTFTLTSPLHHGAGSAGNVALLRRQDIVLPDGTAVRVPVVSGNSVRHMLRAAHAWHLVRTLDVAEGSLSKAVVDLLWSGGALTRTGAEVHLDRARRVARLLPGLALLGYSAGSDMTAGGLFVNHLHLVCQENAWRLPDMAGLRAAGMRAGTFQAEEFGTRHDVAGTAVDRYVCDAGDGDPKTTQMIYTVQVLKAGSVLSGSLDVPASVVPAQRAVLLTVLDEAAPRQGRTRAARLGAKGAVGFGQARLDVDTSLIGDVDEARTTWEEQLRDSRAEVLDLLDELVA